MGRLNSLRVSKKTKVIPPARYKTVLVAVTEVELPSYDDKDIMETKLVFNFYPFEVKTSDSEYCAINAFFYPKLIVGKNLHKFLLSLTESGSIPNEVLTDVTKLEDLIVQLEGKAFWVVSKNNQMGTKNYVVSASPGEFTVPDWVTEKLNGWKAQRKQAETLANAKSEEAKPLTPTEQVLENDNLSFDDDSDIPF